MEQSTEPVVVGVRFSKIGKIYHFAAEAITDIKVSDMVVVETSRGWQLGQVAQILTDADPPPEGWKPIDRRATPRDLLMRQMWQMKEAEVISGCRAKATDLRLVGIKIVSAEYSFDGSRLIILFSSESEEKYDLKSLRSDMQKMFAPSQVEMRQVGPRDVAKVNCGMGACGLETRCCCLFLTEFSSISIRMAKEQGISLTPTEITGMCGRLRCCLIYEYDTYVDARSKLPKRNKRVRTPQGEGKVVDVVPLRGTVIVDLPEVGYREFAGSEVYPADGEGGQPPAMNEPAQTADEKEGPFAISAEASQQASPGEKPAITDEPRAVPRSEPPGSSGAPARPGGPQRGRRDGQGRRQPERGQRGDRPDKSAPDASSRAGQGGKSPRREGPPPGQKGGQPGGRPGDKQREQPRQHSEESGRSPRGGRDQRRRKGPRRDNNTENRT
jgi:cell fate regulator YaaT (PSP1 superfamily)